MNDKPLLLVEDNPDDVKLTLRAFGKNNVLNEVVVAEDGVQAIDYLFGPEQKPLPALVLLDLKLPRMNGIEVLRRIREDPSTKYLPVVVLTSSNEQRDMVESYNLGANGYVRKPVSFGDFVDAARAIGMYWLLLNETPVEAYRHDPTAIVAG